MEGKYGNCLNDFEIVFWMDEGISLDLVIYLMRLNFSFNLYFGI